MSTEKVTYKEIHDNLMDVNTLENSPMNTNPLTDRLQRECRERYYEKKSPDCGNLDAVITYTIKETLTAVEEELETIYSRVGGTELLYGIAAIKNLKT